MKRKTILKRALVFGMALSVALNSASGVLAVENTGAGTDVTDEPVIVDDIDDLGSDTVNETYVSDAQTVYNDGGGVGIEEIPVNYSFGTVLSGTGWVTDSYTTYTVTAPEYPMANIPEGHEFAGWKLSGW